MIIGLIVAFGIVLVLFMPFSTQLRFYISDYNLTFSASLKIGTLPPEYIFAIKNGQILGAEKEKAQSIQKFNIDNEIGLNLKDFRDIAKFVPLTYANTLIYFGDKDNAMRTAMVLKSLDIFLDILEKSAPFPKGKISHTLVPEYNANKLFVQSEIKFSVTLFVIFLTLYKILKKGVKL